METHQIEIKYLKDQIEMYKKQVTMYEELLRDANTSLKYALMPKAQKQIRDPTEKCFATLETSLNDIDPAKIVAYFEHKSPAYVQVADFIFALLGQQCVSVQNAKCVYLDESHKLITCSHNAFMERICKYIYEVCYPIILKESEKAEHDNSEHSDSIDTYRINNILMLKNVPDKLTKQLFSLLR